MILGGMAESQVRVLSPAMKAKHREHQLCTQAQHYLSHVYFRLVPKHHKRKPDSPRFYIEQKVIKRQISKFSSQKHVITDFVFTDENSRDKENNTQVQQRLIRVRETLYNKTLQNILQRKGRTRVQTGRNKARTSRTSGRVRLILQHSQFKEPEESTLVSISALEVIKKVTESCCRVRPEVGKE